MAEPTEWRLECYKDVTGEVYCILYELCRDDQWGTIDTERFGPFDTATDVASWFVRRWAPRVRLPLR